MIRYFFLASCPRGPFTPKVSSLPLSCKYPWTFFLPGEQNVRLPQFRELEGWKEDGALKPGGLRYGIQDTWCPCTPNDIPVTLQPCPGVYLPKASRFRFPTLGLQLLFGAPNLLCTQATGHSACAVVLADQPGPHRPADFPAN